ncbi:hypothetical protein ACJO5Y_01220 [Marinobacter sp. GN3S48]|uniref:hypothetical protein n=1 Tax=Marinobacter sp. GN3S48 TaxID=3382302 RepID=UPI00387B662A
MYFVSDMRDLVRAASPTHLHLRNRLATVILITLMVDVIGSAIIFMVEGSAPTTDIHSFWDAFYWTTSQLLTISSTMANPITVPGQVVCLVLDLYAITVVSTLAGMFSAFFYRRGEERDPLHGQKPTSD